MDAWRLVSICFPALLLLGCQASGPATFKSPEAAFDSYTDALAKSPEATLKVLGSAGEPIVHSGDAVADRRMAQRVAQRYREQHTLSQNPDGSMTAMVGPRGWPMPIPLVKNPAGLWQFDVNAAKEEILNRRIGRNELATIQVLYAIADAEQDYADQRPMGPPTSYAGRFISSPDKKDGLYWPTTQPSDPPSPLGDLIGKAADEGYPTSKPADGSRPAYHGYHYHFLKGQGSHAAGGAWDYVFNGRWIGGFSVIAYPATYGNSGVMTFIINQSGQVYQKDLGIQTTSAAEAITLFDPEPGWTAVTAPPATQPE